MKFAIKIAVVAAAVCSIAFAVAPGVYHCPFTLNSHIGPEQNDYDPECIRNTPVTVTWPIEDIKVVNIIFKNYFRTKICFPQPGPKGLVLSAQYPPAVQLVSGYWWNDSLVSMQCQYDAKFNNNGTITKTKILMDSANGDFSNCQVEGATVFCH